jgi:hypothetical protein
MRLEAVAGVEAREDTFYSFGDYHKRGPRRGAWVEIEPEPGPFPCQHPPQ